MGTMGGWYQKGREFLPRFLWLSQPLPLLLGKRGW